MKDEIKEILGLYKNGDIEYYNLVSDLGYDKLLDYITNLQEENKILKELNVCVGCNNNPDYKLRNEKAIEYLREIEMFERKFGFDGVRRKKLLNILQGEDKDVKD